MDEESRQIGSLQDPSEETHIETERPTVVSLVAVYQWLKALLFIQIAWKLLSVTAQSLTATSEGMPGATARNHAVFFLVAIALYLLIVGLGLWKLQIWALLLMLPIWFLDFTYDFNPDFTALGHIADLLPEGKFLNLAIGISVGDVIAFILFSNRDTLKAFGAEDLAKVFWPNN